MKKQSCTKRQQTGSSSHSKPKKNQAKRQNCPKQKCISSESQWFTPPEFERFGMKEKHKKWKTSILCKGIPLQKLIED
ncbi:nuclear autoantigen Sp-100-like [Carassius gibelio]|uniref:nuclear autoantigen Sp-100-like n=1 Tax=Carassius gibelio TaxID=101364 RepID=UPI002279BFD2|nr:nuclear autoantigen Sp-100-like [Carassius gibelio]